MEVMVCVRDPLVTLFCRRVCGERDAVAMIGRGGDACGGMRFFEAVAWWEKCVGWKERQSEVAITMAAALRKLGLRGDLLKTWCRAWLLAGGKIGG